MENYSFKCRGCGATLSGPASKIGKRARCPKCGEWNKLDLRNVDIPHKPEPIWEDDDLDFDDESSSGVWSNETTKWLLILGAIVVFGLLIQSSGMSTEDVVPLSMFFGAMGLIVWFLVFIAKVTSGDGTQSREFICPNPHCGYRGVANYKPRGESGLGCLLLVILFPLRSHLPRHPPRLSLLLPPLQ